MIRLGAWMTASILHFVSAAAPMFGTPLAVGFVVAAHDRQWAYGSFSSSYHCCKRSCRCGPGFPNASRGAHAGPEGTPEALASALFSGTFAGAVLRMIWFYSSPRRKPGSSICSSLNAEALDSCLTSPTAVENRLTGMTGKKPTDQALPNRSLGDFRSTPDA
jgi:hypothetical protein